MTTDNNTPAMRPIGLIATTSDLDAFLAHLHRNWNNDPEQAHALEDEIKTRVLALVVAAHPYSQDFAKRVLEIDSWDDVTRWYA